MTVATGQWEGGQMELSALLKKNREKTEEPSLGTSDNGATTAPWQLCKVHT